VDKEKGTGFVMCCTFGDETDIKWWREHDLPMKIILNKYGKLDLPESPELNGKKANKETRDLICKMLDGVGAIARERKKIIHVVKTAERSGAPLEIIPTYQWFVKLVDKKERLKEKINECKWYPEYMKVRAEQWNESLSWDWCISRQRYFGVPFPVWYGYRMSEGLIHLKEEPTIFTALEKQLPLNPLNEEIVPEGCEIIDIPESVKTLIHPTGEYEKVRYIKRLADGEIFLLVADRDVMDTWATSSVSPQLSSHWELEPERHKKIIPCRSPPAGA